MPKITAIINLLIVIVIYTLTIPKFLKDLLLFREDYFLGIIYWFFIVWAIFNLIILLW